MKLTVVLAVLIGIFVIACSSAAPAPNIDATVEVRIGATLAAIPPEPTPNIEATVAARLIQERAVEATVEARLKEERSSQPAALPTLTRGASATELLSPRAFHCQEALGQREMAQLELDDDWLPEPETIGRVTILLTRGRVDDLQKERRERLEATIQQAEGDIERFC